MGGRRGGINSYSHVQNEDNQNEDGFLIFFFFFCNERIARHGVPSAFLISA